MVRIKKSMVSSHTLETYEDIPGPTYRDCQSCFSKPAAGIMSTTWNTGYGMVRTFQHVCIQCADPDTFEAYSNEEGD